MFTIQDLINIMLYLQGDTAITLDPKTETIAKNEQGISINYLNDILIPAFNTPDTIRLFNFFIDWYASNKTLVSTAKSASDVYSLPSSHIDELFVSFGFDNRVALHNLYPDVKPVFFKDLVELYKIKGTPKALYTVLEYFEVNLIALYEYSLYKNIGGELEFRREEIYRSSRFSDFGTLSSVNFDDVVNFDPHWLMSREQIEDILDRDGFGLPSKTPYIGIVPSIDLNEYLPYLAYISRYSQDKYYSGDTTTRDIITSINITVSYIELYVGAIYAFLQTYPSSSVPKTLYQSNFSSGNDYWGGVHGTCLGNIDSIGGEDNWLRFTCDTTTSVHYASYGYPSYQRPVVGKMYRISFKYYIPSGQSSLNAIQFYIDGGFAHTFCTSLDTVTSVSVELEALHTGTLLIYGIDSGNPVFAGNNNVFYIKDIVFTEVEDFICYDGTSPYTLDGVTTEYSDLTSVKAPRDERNATIDYLYDTFSRNMHVDFLDVEGGAEAYLTSINPTFKEEIDYYINGSRGDEIVTSLISDLVVYYKDNIDKGYSPLGLFILDFGSFNKRFINDVINFFKPYRARMQFVEKIIKMGNRLEDSLYCDSTADYPIEIFDIYDYMTADCYPSFYGDSTNLDYYSRQHYDTTAIHDIGAMMDNIYPDIGIEISPQDILNYYPADMAPYIQNEYILDSTGNVIFASSNSVGVDLDSGWFTDSPFINDYFYVTDDNIANINTIELLNCHPADATSYIEYSSISSPGVMLMTQDALYGLFDEGSYFDSPFMGDVCNITMIGPDLPGPYDDIVFWWRGKGESEVIPDYGSSDVILFEPGTEHYSVSNDYNPPDESPTYNQMDYPTMANSSIMDSGRGWVLRFYSEYI